MMGRRQQKPRFSWRFRRCREPVRADPFAPAQRAHGELYHEASVRSSSKAYRSLAAVPTATIRPESSPDRSLALSRCAERPRAHRTA